MYLGAGQQGCSQAKPISIRGRREREPGQKTPQTARRLCMTALLVSGPSIRDASCPLPPPLSQRETEAQSLEADSSSSSGGWGGAVHCTRRAEVGSQKCSSGGKACSQPALSQLEPAYFQSPCHTRSEQRGCSLAPAHPFGRCIRGRVGQGVGSQYAFHIHLL